MKGIKFGTAVKASYLASDPTYWNLVKAQSAILSPDTDMQPPSIQNVKGVFTFDRADSFAGYAQGAGLPFRFSAGMIYPAHDMAWVSTNVNNVIVPTLDGNGDPNINASNWQAEIDNHMNAIAARSWAQSLSSINVSNELTDSTQTDGWRRHPWYTATNGPDWLIYAFQKARALWPTTPLGLCQDLTEQQVQTFYYNHSNAFLTNLQTLLTAGVPINFVDLQGHLTFERGYDPKRHRAFLQAIKDMGLWITVGELDIRTGNTGAFIPGNYTNDQYDAAARSIISQYLDTLMPFLSNKSEFVVWELSDKYGAWGASERPCIYDTSFNVKPGIYQTILGHMQWKL